MPILINLSQHPFLYNSSEIFLWSFLLIYLEDPFLYNPQKFVLEIIFIFLSKRLCANL